jgi:Mn-dependent DtxR family transcriptional regulator
MLEVSRGAASMALAQLKRRGWVGEDPNRFLLLTEEGKKIANLIESNFTILSNFFQNVLGVERDTALGDACKMEHLMSLDTGKRLLWLMRFILSDSRTAARIRERMQDFQKGCSPSDIASCPVCGQSGHCLATMEVPESWE